MEKQKFCYAIVEYVFQDETLLCEDNEAFRPAKEYGIAVYCNGKEVERIDSISFDRNLICKLVNLFNEQQLYPVHFAQAVEDFLIDFEI